MELVETFLFLLSSVFGSSMENKGGVVIHAELAALAVPGVEVEFKPAVRG